MKTLIATILSLLSFTAFSQDKVRVAVFPAISAMPYFVALERGYFKEAGIETETIPMTSHPFIVQAFVKGDIEAASNLVTLEGANINQRRPGTLVYFGINGQNHINMVEQFVVRTGHPAQTLKDLKGAKIMSAPGPANVGAAKAVLKAVGLEEGKDYTMQEQQMSVHLGALQAGTFDAAYTLEPLASVIVKNGVARRIEGGVIATYLLGRKDAQAFAAGNALGGEFLAERPAVADALRESHRQGRGRRDQGPEGARIPRQAHERRARPRAERAARALHDGEGPLGAGPGRLPEIRRHRRGAESRRRPDRCKKLPEKLLTSIAGSSPAPTSRCAG